MSLLKSMFGSLSRQAGQPGAPAQEAVVAEDQRPVVVDVPARVLTAYKTPQGLPDIRKFDVKAINDAIERHVSIMKPEEHVVAVAYVDRTGGHVAIVGKVTDKIPGDMKWTVYGTREWDGDWNAGAGVRWSI